MDNHLIDYNEILIEDETDLIIRILMETFF